MSAFRQSRLRRRRRPRSPLLIQPRRQPPLGGARGGSGGFYSVYYRDPLERPSVLANDLPGTANDAPVELGYNEASQIVVRTLHNDSYAAATPANAARGYQVNGLNQYTGTTWGGAPNWSFEYDPNGNLKRSVDPVGTGTTAYLYDVENRLVAASGAANATLAYDPLGRLFQVTNANGARTQFLYDGDKLIAEYDGSGTLTKRYVHGPGADEPVAVYEGPALGLANRRYTLPDERGSIAALVNANGTPWWKNRYDAWGVPGDNKGRFQYTGQAWIDELGLYYYKARLYSPWLGRFLQTDPIGYDDQNNLYAYVDNDPLNRQDPTGLDDVYNFPGRKIIYVPVVNMSDHSDKEVLSNMRIDGVDSSGTRVEVRSYIGREVDSVSVRTDRSLNSTSPDGRRRSHTDSIGGREVTLAPGAGVKTQKHEFGHTLRAGDQYRGGIDTRGHRVLRDVPGSQGTLMGSGKGMLPNTQTIDEISRGANSPRNTQFNCTVSAGHVSC